MYKTNERTLLAFGKNEGEGGLRKIAKTFRVVGVSKPNRITDLTEKTEKKNRKNRTEKTNRLNRL